MAEGYTATYNRRAAGKAWAIAGYTLDGGGLCTACADSRFDAATLSGEAGGDNSPVPLFSSDDATYREGGDHRGGCGLSCDTCGRIIVAACDPCRDSIEQDSTCSCRCGCEVPLNGGTCVDCGEGTHQNNNRLAELGNSLAVEQGV